MRTAAPLAILLLLATSAGASPRVAPCAGGRFLVDGGALVGGDAPADTVVVGSGGLGIGTGCFAAARTSAGRAGTRLRARFAACGDLRKVRLVAKIAAPGCAEMRGTLRAKGVPRRDFRAVRSRCGDGRLDAGGEDCDAGVGCGTAEVCDAACACVPTLDFSLPPVFGSTALASGFAPDPFAVVLTAGGPADAAYLGDGCSGHATSAPSFSVHYTAGASALLRVYVVAEGDTTLIVNTPGGGYACADDSFDTADPTFDFEGPSSGRYDIWVATFAAGESAAATLHVTESAANHP